MRFIIGSILGLGLCCGALGCEPDLSAETFATSLSPLSTGEASDLQLCLWEMEACEDLHAEDPGACGDLVVCLPERPYATKPAAAAFCDDVHAHCSGGGLSVGMCSRLRLECAEAALLGDWSVVAMVDPTEYLPR